MNKQLFCNQCNIGLNKENKSYQRRSCLKCHHLQRTKCPSYKDKWTKTRETILTNEQKKTIVDKYMVKKSIWAIAKEHHHCWTYINELLISEIGEENIRRHKKIDLDQELENTEQVEST